MTGRGRLVLTGLAALAVGLGASACARTGFPPGGEQDFYPPIIVQTSPDTFALLDDLGAKIRVEFSERISERARVGTLDDAVIVSPMTGEVKVSHQRRGLEIEVEGGFRPGLIYRVTILPIVQDMFNNPMDDPFEFAFSTGGEYEQGVIAGLVIDRITGNAVNSAQVLLTPAQDTTGIVYAARTDSTGIYAMRYMPTGQYTIDAFEDLNRDRELDSFEASGQRFGLIGVGDTLLADVTILPMDTTAAILAQTALLDSATIQLTFDDYAEPTQTLTNVEVALQPVPDTTEEGITQPPPAPEAVRILHQRDYETYRDSVMEARQAAADSARQVALQAAADSAAAAGDTTAAARPPVTAGPPRAADPTGAAARRFPGQGANVARPVGRERSLLPEGVPLPSRDLVAILGGPLPAGHTYRVVVSGVVNVRGLGSGGGERTVRREAPPDTATAVPGDSLGMPVDTGAVADTGAVVDTLRLPGGVPVVLERLLRR